MVGGFIAAGFDHHLYTFSVRSRLMEKVMEAKKFFHRSIKGQNKAIVDTGYSTLWAIA